MPSADSEGNSPERGGAPIMPVSEILDVQETRRGLTSKGPARGLGIMIAFIVLLGILLCMISYVVYVKIQADQGIIVPWHGWIW